VVVAGNPISVIAAGRDGLRDPGRWGSAAAPGRTAVEASGVGYRFGSDVVVVSEGAMRARYCVGGEESLGDEELMLLPCTGDRFAIRSCD
jgi:hypothetical protein